MYRLLITYGFKEKIIINIKVEDFNEEEGQILVGADEEQKIYVKLETGIWDEF